MKQLILVIFLLGNLPSFAQSWSAIQGTSWRAKTFIEYKDLLIISITGFNESDSKTVSYDGNAIKDFGTHNGTITSFAIYKDTLFGFLSYNNDGLKKWDGQNWVDVKGISISSRYGNLKVFKDTLYIAVDFTNSDRLSMSYVVKYSEGKSYQAASVSESPVQELLVHNDTLYASTSFKIIRLINNQWHPVGDILGFDSQYGSYYSDMVSFNNNLLYSDYLLNRIGSEASSKVIKWSDNRWVNLKTTTSLHMIAKNDTLFGIPRVSKGETYFFEDDEWKPLGNVIVDTMFISDLITYKDEIYVAGELVVDGQTGVAKLSRNFLSSNHKLNKSEEVKIFPNPVREKLNLIFNSDDDRIVSISDLNGFVHSLFYLESSSECLDVGNLAPGIYLLEIEDKNGKIIDKIIVE